MGIGRSPSKPIEDRPLQWLLEQLSDSLGVGRPVGLREHAGIDGPCAVGWRRPSIVLPVTWRRWDDSLRRAVIAHELSHIQRHDGWYRQLARVPLMLQSFHPLAHWLHRQLRMAQETCADRMAAAIMGSSHAYLNALSRVALQQDAARKRGALPSVSFLSDGLLWRIAMVRRTTVWKSSLDSRWIAAAATTIVVATSALVMGFEPPAADPSGPAVRVASSDVDGRDVDGLDVAGKPINRGEIVLTEDTNQLNVDKPWERIPGSTGFAVIHFPWLREMLCTKAPTSAPAFIQLAIDQGMSELSTLAANDSDAFCRQWRSLFEDLQYVTVGDLQLNLSVDSSPDAVEPGSGKMSLGAQSMIVDTARPYAWNALLDTIDFPRAANLLTGPTSTDPSAGNSASSLSDTELAKSLRDGVRQSETSAAIRSQQHASITAAQSAKLHAVWEQVEHDLATIAMVVPSQRLQDRLPANTSADRRATVEAIDRLVAMVEAIGCGVQHDPATENVTLYLALASRDPAHDPAAIRKACLDLIDASPRGDESIKGMARYLLSQLEVVEQPGNEWKLLRAAIPLDFDTFSPYSSSDGLGIPVEQAAGSGQ
jgi:hypothetical protein